MLLKRHAIWLSPDCRERETSLVQGLVAAEGYLLPSNRNVRCNPSSYDRDALQLFLDNNKELLESYFNDDENNYGIGFYACGYNGQAQQEFAQDWADEGVMVF